MFGFFVLGGLAGGDVAHHPGDVAAFDGGDQEEADQRGDVVGEVTPVLGDPGGLLVRDRVFPEIAVSEISHGQAAQRVGVDRGRGLSGGHKPAQARRFCPGLLCGHAGAVVADGDPPVATGKAVLEQIGASPLGG